MFFSLEYFGSAVVESADTEFAPTQGQPDLKHGILLIRYLSARISCVKTYMANV